jgi:hypothetical protein
LGTFRLHSLHRGGLHLNGFYLRPVQGTDLAYRAGHDALRPQYLPDALGGFVTHFTGHLEV